MRSVPGTALTIGALTLALATDLHSQRVTVPVGTPVLFRLHESSVRGTLGATTTDSAMDLVERSRSAPDGMEVARNQRLEPRTFLPQGTALSRFPPR